MRELLGRVHGSPEDTILIESPEPRGRRLLVTGAAGFIGSALCHRLVAGGHRVVGYDNFSRGRREFLPPAVQLVEGDIRDRLRVSEALAATRPDGVIHLAAMHFIPDCIARPKETLAVNVEGTRSVLESCRESAVRTFVFASTAAVYAPTDGACVEDETPLRPLEVYGESKLEAERLVAAFHEETGVSTRTLRLFNAVGRRETNPHVIPHIFESLQRSDVIPLGNVAPRRDYVDTRDIADAIVAALEGADDFHVLNVGSGTAYSVSDIVDLLRRILHRPITIVQEPGRVRSTERMLLLADVGKMRRLTSWIPRLGLEETLADLATAYSL